MQVTFDLPEELIRYLGNDLQALSRAALEALVLEGVRSDALSTAEARRILRIRTRQQMDPLTAEQVRRDSEVALSFSE